MKFKKVCPFWIIEYGFHYLIVHIIWAFINLNLSKFSSKLNTNTFKRKVSQWTDNYTTGFEKYQEEFNKKFKKNKNMEDKNKSNNIAEEKKKMQELINRLEQKYKKNSDISDPLKLKVVWIFHLIV